MISFSRPSLSYACLHANDAEASYAAPCADLSRRPTLTLADFCARSASLPPANGGVLYFRDVRYSVDVGRAGRRRTVRRTGAVDMTQSFGTLMRLNNIHYHRARILGKVTKSLTMDHTCRWCVQLEVLKGNISGMVSAGEMMALMGPSGAGTPTQLQTPFSLSNSPGSRCTGGTCVDCLC
jgi:hypothetical protein